MRLRRLFQSIRFRLSLAFALTVFSVGSLLIGGIYLYQVNRLDEPIVETRRVNLVDGAGNVTETDFRVAFPEDLQRAAAQWVEQEAYRVALNQLRRASFGALGILFIASFSSGWLLSGWALRPVDRINNVARDISATDLSRRIAMRGPDDELKALADTFDAMLDRLQGAFEDQRRFVHEASHELRNPLAVARTNLELALDGGSIEELRRGAEIAHRSTGRMSLLVDDLLEQARHGVPELRRSEVDCSQLVADIAVEFRAAAATRRLTIDADLGPGDLVIQGDGPALRRALSNLVANAVRLAPAGSTIRVAALAEGDDCVRIDVIDEGPGIARADQAKVFDRFWRGDDASAGSGLGLNIVRRVAERHGGSAVVLSEPGVGSTFSIRLPATTSRSSLRDATIGSPAGLTEPDGI